MKNDLIHLAKSENDQNQDLEIIDKKNIKNENKDKDKNTLNDQIDDNKDSVNDIFK